MNKVLVTLLLLSVCLELNEGCRGTIVRTIAQASRVPARIPRARRPIKVTRRQNTGARGRGNRGRGNHQRKKRQLDGWNLDWTVGQCWQSNRQCRSNKYTIEDVFQIFGEPLTEKDFFFSFFDVKLPRNAKDCNQLCKCLTCGTGSCSQDSQKCSNGGSICTCNPSNDYPFFEAIATDMMATSNACRRCDSSWGRK